MYNSIFQWLNNFYEFAVNKVIFVNNSLFFVCLVMCIDVIAKYVVHSSSATDVGRREIDTVTAAALSDDPHQHMPVLCYSENVMDRNPTLDLSNEQQVLLTDITDVINQESAEICEISFSSASYLPVCDLQAAISSAKATTELSSNHVDVNQRSISSVHVCSAAEFPAAVQSINTAGTLPFANPGSSDNRLAAAFTAQQKKPS